MKALVRGKDVLTEDMGVRSIDWDTGKPLINPDWAGGSYTLVENYVPHTEETEQEQTDVLTPYGKRNAEIAELKARLAALEKEV